MTDATKQFRDAMLPGIASMAETADCYAELRATLETAEPGCVAMAFDLADMDG